MNKIMKLFKRCNPVSLEISDITAVKSVGKSHLTRSSELSFTFKSSILLATTSSRYLGANHSKYSFHGKLGSMSPSIPSAHAVSYVHVRATFFTVYPPPPSRISGMFCCRRNCTQWACPFIVTLKQPSLSPAKESAPH